MPTALALTVEVPGLSYWGAVDLPTKGRKKLPYSKSGTCAYVPSSLFKSESNLKLPVETLIHYPRVTLEFLKSLKSDIQNHVEARIQVLFQLFLLLYRTGLKHEIRSTDLQVGGGNGTYAAAHSATFPSLLTRKDDQAVVLAKGTTLYNGWNATVLLPKAVNKVDSLLDLYHRKLKLPAALRVLALGILNQVSASNEDIDPKKGLKLFVDVFLRLINRALEMGNSESITQESVILEFYKQVAESYSRQLSEDDAIIKSLTFASAVPEVNEEFYLNMQGELIRTLLRELAAPAAVHEIIARRASPARPIALPPPPEASVRENSDEPRLHPRRRSTTPATVTRSRGIGSRRKSI